MDPVSTIRDRAIKLLEEAEPGATIKAAELLNTASQIEQVQANLQVLDEDRKKLEQELNASRNHWNKWKDVLTALAPVLTTAILAGTLIFQVIQNNHAETERRDAETKRSEDAARQNSAAEQARFTEALNSIQTSEHISTAATRLNSFTQEPQKTQARQMGLKLLDRANSFEDFQDLFSSLINPGNPAEFPALTQLNRSVWAKLGPLQNKAYGKGHYEKPRNEEGKRYDLLVSELHFVSDRMVPLIRAARSGGAGLDLSATAILDADLRGADLRNANISGVNLSYVNLDGSDMGDITSFQGAEFYVTPWWHAARISKPLLEYLKKSWPYAQVFRYNRADESPSPVSEADYNDRLRNLDVSGRP
jgi:hypothetical protein